MRLNSITSSRIITLGMNLIKAWVKETLFTMINGPATEPTEYQA